MDVPHDASDRLPQGNHLYSTSPACTTSAHHGRAPASSSLRLFQIAMQATITKNDPNKESDDLRESNSHRVIQQSAYNNRTRTIHLTTQQWQLLADYHEHDLFTRTRSWGFCLAIFGIGVTIFGLASPAWMWIGDVRQPHQMGLWSFCYPNTTCVTLVYYLNEEWKLHTIIVCLLGFACIFGTLGLGLAVTGACRSSLMLRLYYYHSAGECFLVSSFAIVGSLFLYRSSVKASIRNLFDRGFIQVTRWTNVDATPYQYAYNYYLTWSAALFLSISFICMNLDILIQSFFRSLPFMTTICNCPTRCRKKRTPRDSRLSTLPNRTVSTVARLNGLPSVNDSNRSSEEQDETGLSSVHVDDKKTESNATSFSEQYLYSPSDSSEGDGVWV